MRGVRGAHHGAVEAQSRCRERHRQELERRVERRRCACGRRAVRQGGGVHGEGLGGPALSFLCPGVGEPYRQRRRRAPEKGLCELTQRGGRLGCLEQRCRQPRFVRVPFASGAQQGACELPLRRPALRHTACRRYHRRRVQAETTELGGCIAVDHGAPSWQRVWWLSLRAADRRRVGRREHNVRKVRKVRKGLGGGGGGCVDDGERVGAGKALESMPYAEQRRSQQSERHVRLAPVQGHQEWAHVLAQHDPVGKGWRRRGEHLHARAPGMGARPRTARPCGDPPPRALW